MKQSIIIPGAWVGVSRGWGQTKDQIESSKAFSYDLLPPVWRGPHHLLESNNSKEAGSTHETFGDIKTVLSCSPILKLQPKKCLLPLSLNLISKIALIWTDLSFSRLHILSMFMIEWNPSKLKLNECPISLIHVVEISHGSYCLFAYEYLVSNRLNLPLMLTRPFSSTYVKGSYIQPFLTLWLVV